MAVVKGDGYGHGATAVGRAALRAGASELAVATVGEGAELRTVGITAPILVLSAIDPEEVGTALSFGLELTVGTEELFQAVAVAADAGGRRDQVGVHVKVDSGMRRYGARPDLAVALAERVANHRGLSLAGFSTHFAAADEPGLSATEDQAAIFDQALANLAERGVRPTVVHAANSAATIHSRRYHYGMVRVGIALYGLPPSAEIQLLPGMKPVMSLGSRVTRVVRLDPGDKVGYGRTYRAATEEHAVVVPVGYADGYPRALSNVGWMAIGRGRCPVIGRVSMDQTVIRIPEDLDVQVGTEVSVFGGGSEQEPTVQELARLVGTIPYEIVTQLTRRLPRQYLGGGEGYVHTEPG